MKTKLLLTLCASAAFAANAFADNFNASGSTAVVDWPTLAAGRTPTIADQMRIQNGATANLDFGAGGSVVFGNFEHNGGAIVNLQQGKMGVGDIIFTNSTVNVFSGATLAFTRENANTGQWRFGVGRAGGTATLNIDGGLVTTETASDVTSTFNVAHDGGDNNTGAIVNITNGGQFKKGTNGNLVVNIGATSAGSTATVNISGTGSLMQTSNNAGLGNNTALFIGTSNGSNANVNVSDGGTLAIVRETGTNVFAQIGTNNAAGSTAKINVGKDGVFLVKNAGTTNGDITLNMGTASDAGVFIKKDGVMRLESATTGTTLSLKIGNNESNNLIEVDGGSIVSVTNGNDHTIIMGDTISSNSLIHLKNEGQILSQGTSNLQIEIGRNGKAEIRMDANTNLFTSGNIQMGTRASAGTVGTLNINGGHLAGKGGIGSNSGDINMATRHQTAAYLNITDGGDASIRHFRMSQKDGGDGVDGGVNSTSYVMLKDLNSVLKVNNSVVLGVEATSGNVAEVKIFSGAQLEHASGSEKFTINETGKVLMMLQGNVIPNATDIAMIKARNLTAMYNGDVFVIDGSTLHGSWANEGDYTVLLMEFANGTTLDIFGITGDLVVGTDSDADILAALMSLIDIQNNTGNAGWEDFTAADITYSGGKLYLGLHSIPEPGTYAAIFGALALAFAAYRRRK